MEENNKEYQEEINITTNTSYLNEKSLEKDNKLFITIFELILCTFSSSLFVQVLGSFRNSYKVIYILPNIVLIVLLIVFVVNYFVKKQLTLKTYFVILAVLVGIIIGL